jgi:aldehyde:ferredoxin oxidoreductase
MVVTKSPLTGAVIRSTGGARFGHGLKSAGIDMLVIEGKAEKPVTLVIRDSEVEFHDATHLWGTGIDTETLQNTIRTELADDKMTVACIGPAGEGGNLFAAIVSERRSASRGGVGTVMGSKNLKAIAVRGTHKVEVADSDKLTAVTKTNVGHVRKDDTYASFSHLGTAGVTAFLHEIGMHPVMNFQRGMMDDFSGLAPEKFEEIFLKNEGCSRCYVHCGNHCVVKEGVYQGKPVVGPEYETVWSFGANLGITDLGFIVAANMVCDDYGVDTITMGVVLSFAMELFQKGILTKADLDGLDLSWGNDKAAFALLLKTLKRQGIGEILSLGTKRASEKIGKDSDKYAMHVKGLELPAYEPRAAKAHGLNLATATVGASHTMGYAGQEIFGIPEQIERFGLEGKGALTKANQDMSAVTDSLIMCLFPACFGWVTINTSGRLLYAATGVEEFTDEDYLVEAGERIFNLEKAFNVREGFTRKDDFLPGRFLKESLPGGPAKGRMFEMDQLLDDYYAARGWDKEDGKPTREKLLSLGLDGET